MTNIVHQHQDLEYFGQNVCADTCATARAMILLSAIQQLQRYAIVFRNMLASNRISAVEEATYNSLICYEDFLWTKKQQAIFGGMVESRLSNRMPSKDSD
jgi:hypothetical protein